MAWRVKLRPEERKYDERGGLRRRRENWTGRQDAYSSLGHHQLTGTWWVKGKLDFSSHLPPQPGALGQGTPCPIFAAAWFYLSSASELLCDLGQAHPLPGPQSPHLYNRGLINMFFRAFRPCSVQGAHGLS